MTNFSIGIAEQTFFRKSALLISALLLLLGYASSHSNAALGREVQEEGVIAAFLQSGVADWKPTTFCVNTTLASLDRESIDRLSFLPGMSGKSPQAQSYLEDLKLVSEGLGMRPVGTIAADRMKTDAFKVRPGTYRECTELPTYRFNRALLKQNQAVVSGRFATKCATIPFGANLRSQKGKWTADYVAYYQSTGGPPGCSHMSKVYAGSETDTFLIMER